MTEIYLDTDRPTQERIDDLVSKMTIEEKIGQICSDSPAIERLGISKYNWWNECLHGLARSGRATVFPQAIGMAASFNPDLLGKIGTAVSDEARAKYHQAAKENKYAQYIGLNFWTPNINIFRDPRWGRGQETYGEDPHLTGKMAVAYITGLQGDDPKYLKVAATAKHYVVHSGPDPLRHHFNAKVGQKDLYETYMPAFKAAVRQAKVESVMGTYNRTNGEPCSGSKLFLTDILRGKLGFEGHVVSDCDAIFDIFKNHKCTPSLVAAAAMAVKNGCDLNCGCTYQKLVEAIKTGIATEADIEVALKRVLKTQFKLGMFDPDEKVPYTQIKTDVIECKKHLDIAEQMARESIVLLKNKNNILPLAKDLNKVAIIGPNADSVDALVGNYQGNASSYITMIEAITGKLSVTTKIQDTLGCQLIGDKMDSEARLGFCAEEADVIIAGLGMTKNYEGEENDTMYSVCNGDRPDIDLPGRQMELLETLHKFGKPIILVLFGGSPVSLEWAKQYVDAIVYVWYPGQHGGAAIADVIFGDYNPAGRLPVTFPRSIEDLPDFEDYNMEHGFTYRYFKHDPVYKFGYGLSYTKFGYSDLEVTAAKGELPDIDISVTVKNTGKMAGDEVVQLYVKSPADTGNAALKGFSRINLKSGQDQKVTFKLTPEDYACFDKNGTPTVYPGKYEISVGGCQKTDSDAALTTEVLTGEFTIEAKAPTAIEY